MSFNHPISNSDADISFRDNFQLRTFSSAESSHWFTLGYAQSLRQFDRDEVRCCKRINPSSQRLWSFSINHRRRLYGDHREGCTYFPSPNKPDHGLLVSKFFGFDGAVFRFLQSADLCPGCLHVKQTGSL